MDRNAEIIPGSRALTLQQELLAYGMFYGKNDAVVKFTVSPQGSRKHIYKLNPDDPQRLISRFRSDPKDCLALARQNLSNIVRDPKLPEYARKDRLKRYIREYCDLMIKLDLAAFPANPTIKQGVPEYIPDGLNDMGADTTVEARMRSREKIRVDKRIILRRAEPLLYELLSSPASQLNSSEFKIHVVERIAQYVYEELPYDLVNKGNTQFNRSVSLEEIREKKLAVCRHQALYAQVLLQSLGISSRLMKTDVLFEGARISGPHANNAVRINNNWYLLDVTNPEIRHDRKKYVFLRRIPERTLDLNNQKYVWSFTLENGQKRQYKSRNNMYYTIEDNVKNPR